MQKQSINNYVLEYDPVNLPADFPVFYCHTVLNDSKITGLHVHDCLEIGYCYDGAGIFIVDNRVIPFSQGDVSIIFKNQFHKAQSYKGMTSNWKFVMLKPETLLCEININSLKHIIKFCGENNIINIISCKQHPQISSLVFSIIEELKNKQQGYKDIVKALIWAMLNIASRINNNYKDEILNKNNKEHTVRHNLLKIAPALDYISKNYFKPITVQQLCKVCNYSESSLRRYFLASVGITPFEYIEKVRIQMACILLKTSNYSILDVSNKVGYSSLSSFNRQFKTITGMSPRMWRKKE